MSAYAKDIAKILGCSANEAGMVEDIMRNEVFHSTLDWQSEAEFRRGARKAWRIFQENRADYEAFTASVKAAFLASPTGRAMADHTS